MRKAIDHGDRRSKRNPMPDIRFFEFLGPITFDEAARLCGLTSAVAAGPGVLHRVAAPDEDDLIDAAVFVENRAHFEPLGRRPVGLLLTTQKLQPEAPDTARQIWASPSPRLAFGELAARLHRERRLSTHVGVDPSAQIAASAHVHDSAIIGAGAQIGARTSVGPFCAIGPGVVIGDDVQIHAGVTISMALIGSRVIIKPGARIGQAGFGFVPSAQGLVAAPQIGRVVIEDDAEIGANTAIDRGALGDTFIGRGAKIDNLVQIGHNVRIGAGAVLAGQVGVSGSTVVGAGAMLGGRVGLADHLTIGEGAQIAASAGVMHDVPAGEKWSGIPAKPIRQHFREIAAVSRLTKRGKADRDGD